jgi:hypothetical protein
LILSGVRYGWTIATPPGASDRIKVGTAEYTVESGDLRVKRTRLSERDGQCQRVYYHYTIEGPDGTREADELDEWGLFTVEEMLAAFSAVGLAATYDPSWRDPAGDGVYVASVPA